MYASILCLCSVYLLNTCVHPDYRQWLDSHHKAVDDPDGTVHVFSRADVREPATIVWFFDVFWNVFNVFWGVSTVVADLARPSMLKFLSILIAPGDHQLKDVGNRRSLFYQSHSLYIPLTNHRERKPTWGRR